MALLRGGGDACYSWLLDDCGMGAVSPVRWRRSGVLFSLGYFSAGLLASCCVVRGRVDEGKGGAEANAADVYSAVCLFFVADLNSNCKRWNFWFIENSVYERNCSISV